jgi:hypothetical protein
MQFRSLLYYKLNESSGNLLPMLLVLYFVLTFKSLSFSAFNIARLFLFRINSETQNSWECDRTPLTVTSARSKPLPTQDSVPQDKLRNVCAAYNSGAFVGFHKLIL